MKSIIFSRAAILLFSLFLITMQYSFGGKVDKFFVTKYGAVNDGKTINTKAIQKAIDEANKQNGGIVVFTKGMFLTGSIRLKSGVKLLLEEGAVLLGSTDPRDYLEIENAPISPKTDDNSKLALLLANDVKDISIYGKGTIDGQGRELALTIDSLHKMGIRIDPHYNSRPSETMRPDIINFMRCVNVSISGITITNSSCWVQHYQLCTNLTIDSVTIISRAFWNNDGMDITDCNKVSITNCNINSDDDGICLKSYYPGYCDTNIYIANCWIRSSACAIKMGTASIGGFKNITIKNIKVQDTHNSAIAIESVDGGTIENINVSDINAINTSNAIFIRLGYRSGKEQGSINNITLKNIKVQVPYGIPDVNYDMCGPAISSFHNQFPISITGIPDAIAKNIQLENIEVTYPGRASKGYAYVPLWFLNIIPENIRNYPEYNMFGELPSWGFYVRHVDGISMKNIKLKLDDYDYRPAFVFDDVKNLKMERIEIPIDKKEQIIFKNIKDFDLDSRSKYFVREY